MVNTVARTPATAIMAGQCYLLGPDDAQGPALCSWELPREMNTFTRGHGQASHSLWGIKKQIVQIAKGWLPNVPPTHRYVYQIYPRVTAWVVFQEILLSQRADPPNHTHFDSTAKAKLETRPRVGAGRGALSTQGKGPGQACRGHEMRCARPHTRLGAVPISWLGLALRVGCCPQGRVKGLWELGVRSYNCIRTHNCLCKKLFPYFLTYFLNVPKCINLFLGEMKLTTSTTQNFHAL